MDKATVGRWLKDGPATMDACWKLARALDIDPFVLWFDRTTFDGAYATLAKFSIGRALQHYHPALAFLDETLKPSLKWPPQVHAENTGRPWRLGSLMHDARQRRNFYQPSVLTRKEPSVAQTFYWAFRDSYHDRPTPWRCYGIVVASDVKATLYNSNGQTDETDCRPDGSFVTETWFGEGASEFRIASIHDFECAAEPSPVTASVRFAFPGGE